MAAPSLLSSCSRVPLFTFPVRSSFWTLNRFACGNFPGVIFAALLAPSLTSLSSVYPRRRFSLHPSFVLPVSLVAYFRSSVFRPASRQTSAESSLASPVFSPTEPAFFRPTTPPCQLIFILRLKNAALSPRRVELY